jgi:Sugar kinases, ribokinase family
MSAKTELAEKISGGLRNIPAMIGLDGFVDEIIHVVDKRQDADHYTRMQTMREYSARLMGGCGLSMNIEIVPVQVKLGGNGPIFANALKKQNIWITYIGAVGENSLHPIFSELSDGSDLIGLSDPAQTEAYEFIDGKIIVTRLNSFNSVTWDRIMSVIGLEKLIRMIQVSDLIGFENWTMLPHMSDIWSNVIQNVFPAISAQGKTVFFDLADPEKREREDIMHAIELIGRFTQKGFKTILGLNKKEACELAEIYLEKIEDYHAYPLQELCCSLKKHMPVTCLVVHPVDCASCVTGDEYFTVQGPYCANPVLTTGAGDNFNAGFVMGWMNGFSTEESLLCGVGTSGFYVRNGRSPSSEELAEFLINWDNERI